MAEQTITNDVAAIVACITYNMIYGLERPKFQFKDDAGEYYRFDGRISEEEVIIRLAQPSSSYMQIEGSGEKFSYSRAKNGELEIRRSGSYFSGRDSDTGMNFEVKVESSRVTFTNTSLGNEVVFDSFS